MLRELKVNQLIMLLLRKTLGLQKILCIVFEVFAETDPFGDIVIKRVSIQSCGSLENLDRLRQNIFHQMLMSEVSITPAHDVRESKVIEVFLHISKVAQERREPFVVFLLCHLLQIWQKLLLLDDSFQEPVPVRVSHEVAADQMEQVV